MTSPRLMPMRNSMRRDSGTASLRVAMMVWISTAHSVALITLGNSASMPSPAVEVKRLPERERDGYIPHRGGEREGSAEGDASVECSRAINVGGSWLPRLGSNQRLP